MLHFVMVKSTVTVTNACVSCYSEQNKALKYSYVFLRELFVAIRWARTSFFQHWASSTYRMFRPCLCDKFISAFSGLRDSGVAPLVYRGYVLKLIVQIAISSFSVIWQAWAQFGRGPGLLLQGCLAGTVGVPPLGSGLGAHCLLVLQGLVGVSWVCTWGLTPTWLFFLWAWLEGLTYLNRDSFTLAAHGGCWPLYLIPPHV